MRPNGRRHRGAPPPPAVDDRKERIKPSPAVLRTTTSLYRHPATSLMPSPGEHRRREARAAFGYSIRHSSLRCGTPLPVMSCERVSDDSSPHHDCVLRARQRYSTMVTPPACPIDDAPLPTSREIHRRRRRVDLSARRRELQRACCPVALNGDIVRQTASRHRGARLSC